MWMRQMTLDQIDLEGNGFHEALNAFIISHTMEGPGRAEPSNFHPFSSASGTGCAAENGKVFQQCDPCCDPLLCSPSLARFLRYANKVGTWLQETEQCGISAGVNDDIVCMKQCSQYAVSITRIMKAASLRCRSQMNIHPAPRPRSHRGPAHAALNNRALTLVNRNRAACLLWGGLCLSNLQHAGTQCGNKPVYCVQIPEASLTIKSNMYMSVLSLLFVCSQKRKEKKKKTSIWSKTETPGTSCDHVINRSIVTCRPSWDEMFRSKLVHWLSLRIAAPKRKKLELCFRFIQTNGGAHCNPFR